MRKRIRLEDFPLPSTPILPVAWHTVGTFKDEKNADKLAEALSVKMRINRRKDKKYHYVEVATPDTQSAYEILYVLFPLT